MKYKRWSESECRQLICDVGKRFYDQFFVAGNDGNISVRLDDSQILITPSGISKGLMKPEDLVIMSMDGELLDAPSGMVPSSEARMHLIIYQNRADVRAVTHAHPPTATGFAVAGVSLDKPFLPEVVCRIGPTPCVPYTIPGGNELPESLLPYLAKHDSLLLGNHGAVAYGPTLREAQFNLETVELNARIFLTASQLGNVNYLSEQEIAALVVRYNVPPR